MLEGAVILKFLSIFLLTMLKFIAGPVGGYLAGFPYVATVLLTIGGCMASVAVFTFFGEFLRDKVFRKIFRNRKTFSPKSRRFVTIWKKYGVVGVAVLTPLLLTPIGGTLLLVSAGTPRRQILVYMLGSAVFWSIVLSALIYLLGTGILPDTVVIPV
jgi:hypothetical protein